jgi:hypothetical protein
MKFARENIKLAKVLAEALQNQRFVTLNVYNEKGDQQITGLITKIDQELQRVKLSHDKGIDWIPLDDILNVELTTG